MASPFRLSQGTCLPRLPFPGHISSLLMDVSSSAAGSTLPCSSRFPGARHSDSTSAPSSVGHLSASVTNIEKVNSRLSKNREFNGRYNYKSGLTRVSGMAGSKENSVIRPTLHLSSFGFLKPLITSPFMVPKWLPGTPKTTVSS